MAAIKVLKSHILPYKLIVLSDFRDFCVVSYDLELDEANGAKKITMKYQDGRHFLRWRSFGSLNHTFFHIN